MAETMDQMHNSTCAEDSDDLQRFRRFLFYGTEGNSYHIGDKQFSAEQVPSLLRLIESGQDADLVDEILMHSKTKKTIAPDALVFALAMCARASTNVKTKQAAYKVLSEVCPTPTQLFYFVNYAVSYAKTRGKTAGWGRAQRKAISDWYNNKDPVQLAIAVTKFIQRKGWSHGDLIRLAHVKPTKDSTALILKYVIKGLAEVKKQFVKEEAPADVQNILSYLEVVDIVKHSRDPHQVACLIEEHLLSKEHVPTILINSKEIWKALLQHMPLEEVIQNLGKMTSLRVLDPLSNDTQAPFVIDKLKSETAVKDSKLHPYTILLAQKTYEQAKAEKGKLKWIPNGAVIEALNVAFTTAFKNNQPTNKRYLIAVDVNSSLNFGGVSGASQVKPIMAAATIAMAIAKAEQQYEMVAFSKNVSSVRLTSQMHLQDVCKALMEVNRKLPSKESDCAMPIQWALDQKKTVDVFVLFTDCESCSSATSPADSIKKYRQQMDVPDARLVICALTSNSFSAADPNDPGMLDIVGFNSTAPHVLRRFAAGEL